MEQICTFKKYRDLQKHVPALHIDIKKAVESNTITGKSSIEEFNHLDIDTVQNGVRLREPFDAIEYHRNISSRSGEFSSGTGSNVTSVASGSSGSGQSSTSGE